VAERAFNKLGHQLKTWKDLQPASNALILFAALATEHELASSIDFRDDISDFAMKKSK
jgi:hypothetical protein